MTNYKILNLKKKMGHETIEIHPVVFYNSKDLILFDAGFPGQISDFESELKKYNFTIGNITKIIVSHHDHDHIGSLKDLKDINPNIEIISSKEEKPFINGDEKPLRIIQAEKYNETLTDKELEFGNMFLSYLKTIKFCEVNTTVEDNQYITDDLKVIFTPGHTPGHISLLLENEKIVFAGDALAIENGKPVIANPQFTLDMNMCRMSIEKIRDIFPNKIICYHGGIVDENIVDFLHELL